MKRLLILVVALALAPGCLVLSLNPSVRGRDDRMGSGAARSWQDVDDKSSMEIERGEWKSYRIKYVHPVETGILTGHLTSIGDDRFLDVMPARRRGSRVVPASRARRAARRARRRSSRADAALVRLDERSPARGHAPAGLERGARSQRERPDPGVHQPRSERGCGGSPRTVRCSAPRRRSSESGARRRAVWERESANEMAFPRQLALGLAARRRSSTALASEPQRGRVHALRTARARDGVVQDRLRRDRGHRRAPRISSIRFGSAAWRPTSP